MILPYGLAFVAVMSTVFLIVMGGSTLSTLIMAKLIKGSQLVLSFSDGGLAELRRMDFKGEHGVLEDGRNFLLYATPLSDTTYSPDLLVIKPGDSDDMVKAITIENARRTAEADRLNAQMPFLNDMSKRRSFLQGNPLWIGHAGLGVAFPPMLLGEMEKAGIKIPKGSQVAKLELITADTIKDFVKMNFSRKRLTSIYRAGVDEGLFGRPRKPFNPLIIILAVFAIIALMIGLLILSGKVDLSGMVRGVTG